MKANAATPDADDVLARIIVLIALSNLNGVMYMWLGIGQVFSIPMFGCAAWLFLRSPRLRVDGAILAFLVAIGCYAFFGLIFIPLANASDAEPLRLLIIFSTVLLVMSLISHIQQIRGPDRLRSFLIFIRNLSIGVALCTLLSPLLYQVFLNPPPSAEYRYAGLFANPNEAGLMCVLAYTMVAVLPLRRIPLQYAIQALIVLSALATFSRAAILAILVTIAVSVVQARAWVRLAVTPLILAAFVIIATDPMMIVGWIEQQSIVELDQQQEIRLESAVLAATGEIDTHTSNSRTDMLEISLERAMEMFPLGSGLGTFHHIRGGIMEDGEWLGSHNLFMMVWGEGGFFTLVAWIVFTVAVAVASRRSTLPLLSIYLLILFIVNALTGHNTLETRFINVVLALMLALPVWQVAGQRRPRNAGPAPA